MFTILVVVCENWELFTEIEVLSLFSRSIHNSTTQRSLDTVEVRWNLELNSQFIVVVEIETREVLNKRYFVDVVVSSDFKFDILKHFDIHRASVDVELRTDDQLSTCPHQNGLLVERNTCREFILLSFALELTDLSKLAVNHDNFILLIPLAVGDENTPIILLGFVELAVKPDSGSFTFANLLVVV